MSKTAVEFRLDKCSLVVVLQHPLYFNFVSCQSLNSYVRFVFLQLMICFLKKLEKLMRSCVNGLQLLI